MRYLAVVVGLVACKDGTPPPPASAPADCVKVAEILTNFEAGPAVQPDARGAIVAKHREACKANQLNAGEATCIAKATSTWGALECAPRMFPERAGQLGSGSGAGSSGSAAGGTGDCRAVTTRMREAIVADMPPEIGGKGIAMVDKMMVVIESSCREDGWPGEYKTCVLAAMPGDMAGFKKCDDMLPQELQLKMGERLKPIVKGTAEHDAGP